MKRKKLRKRRERGLDDMAAVITALYGDRCSRHEAGCICCTAWAIFDVMD